MDFLLNGLDGSQPMYAPFAYQPLQASNTINSSPSLRDPVLATPLGPIGMTWGPMPLLGSVPGPGALQPLVQYPAHMNAALNQPPTTYPHHHQASYHPSLGPAFQPAVAFDPFNFMAFQAHMFAPVAPVTTATSSSTEQPASERHVPSTPSLRSSNSGVGNSVAQPASSVVAPASDSDYDDRSEVTKHPRRRSSDRLQNASAEEQWARRIVPRKTEGEHVCKVCREVLPSRQHLREHISRQHVKYDDAKPFQCPTCMRAFKRIAHLHRHQTVHSGERRFVCPKCTKTFARNDHLTAHLWTHETAPYICHICRREEPSNFELKRHVVTAHPLRIRRKRDTPDGAEGDGDDDGDGDGDGDEDEPEEFDRMDKGGDT